jgi:hypothetical protein
VRRRIGVGFIGALCKDWRRINSFTSQLHPEEHFAPCGSPSFDKAFGIIIVRENPGPDKSLYDACTLCFIRTASS